MFVFVVDRGVCWTEAEFMSEFLKAAKLTVEQGDSGTFPGTIETPSRDFSDLSSVLRTLEEREK